MRKADVTLHSDGYGDTAPAVNVKNYGSLHDVDFSKLYTEEGFDEAFTLDWITSNLDEAGLQVWYEAAQETCWDMLNGDAKDVFGNHIEVEARGRSGGWATVTGLKDFEQWNAVDVSKWARFKRYAETIAADLYSQMAVLIYINVYERIQEERAALAEKYGGGITQKIIVNTEPASVPTMFGFPYAVIRSRIMPVGPNPKGIDHLPPPVTIARFRDPEDAVEFGKGIAEKFGVEIIDRVTPQGQKEASNG